MFETVIANREHSFLESSSMNSSRYLSKSTWGMNSSDFNDSIYNLDLLQWQSKEDESGNTSKTNSTHKQKKDHIRENIRRLRYLQDSMNQTRNASNGRVLLTDRTSHTLSNIRHIQNLPPRPVTSDKIMSKHYHNLSSIADNNHKDNHGSTLPVNLNQDYFKNTNSYETGKNVKPSLESSSVQCEDTNVLIISPEDTHKSDQLTQTLPLAISTTSFDDKMGQNYCSISSQKHINRVTESASINKHSGYLRAHARDVEDEVDLHILGNIPIMNSNKHLNSEKVTVPKAKSSKNVPLIRRDVNFVRVNAHLASNPNSRFTNLRRVSSTNSLLSSGKSQLVNENSLNSHKCGVNVMWPERKLPTGAVPAYLIKKRQKEKRLAELEALNQPDPDQPPGHQLMPEQERVDTLELLLKAHTELLEELSHLPIRLDTLRIRSRRAEIERRLAELEQAIGIFSKPKVFIKPD